MWQWFFNLFSRKSKVVAPPTVKPVEIPAPQPTEKSESTVSSDSKYSSRFDYFITFIFSAECVFAKGHYGDLKYVITETVSGDSGGTTKWGVDAASHPGVDIKNLTEDQAKDIYFKEWNDANIEQYSYPLGECIFDCNVNCGAGRTKKLLSSSGEDVVKFMKAREQFYIRLADSVSKDQKFLKGWINRIADCAKFLKIDLS